MKSFLSYQCLNTEPSHQPRTAKTLQAGQADRVKSPRTVAEFLMASLRQAQDVAGTESPHDETAE